MAKSTKASSAAKAPAKPRKAPARKTTGKGKVTEISVPHERVAELAHRYWAERGYRHGFDAEDWLRAEQALRKKAS